MSYDNDVDFLLLFREIATGKEKFDTINHIIMNKVPVFLKKVGGIPFRLLEIVI